jgi:hypothetical protein
MTTGVQPDRIAMSQRERDVLKVMQPVPQGERTQAENHPWREPFKQKK